MQTQPNFRDAEMGRNVHRRINDSQYAYVSIWGYVLFFFFNIFIGV